MSDIVYKNRYSHNMIPHDIDRFSSFPYSDLYVEVSTSVVWCAEPVVKKVLSSDGGSGQIAYINMARPRIGRPDKWDYHLVKLSALKDEFVPLKGELAELLYG